MHHVSKIIVFLLFSAVLSAQTREPIRGKITSDGRPVPGIVIMNLVSEQVVESNASGIFEVSVAVDDLLVFSSQEFYYKRKLIEVEDVGKILEIELEPKVEMLDEVVITYDISPESLGIVPEGQKKYTVAERRLKTASDLDLVLYTGTMAGVGMGLDPVINAITGRTKELRRNMETERRNIRLQQLRSLFEETYYTERLDISPAHVGAFEYYLVENPEFIAQFNPKYKARAQFLITRLAFDFRQLLNTLAE